MDKLINSLHLFIDNEVLFLIMKNIMHFQNKRACINLAINLVFFQDAMIHKKSNQLNRVPILKRGFYHIRKAHLVG